MLGLKLIRISDRGTCCFEPQWFQLKVRKPDAIYKFADEIRLYFKAYWCCSCIDKWWLEIRQMSTRWCPQLSSQGYGI